MLNQEIVTFSGDTAVAKLDIQVGKGPFAPAADGLVKIGETMTLVVSVEGDPAFDLQVSEIQHSSAYTRNNVITRFLSFLNIFIFKVFYVIFKIVSRANFSLDFLKKNFVD